MSDYRNRHTNQHGAEMNGMNEGSTCEEMCSRTDDHANICLQIVGLLGPDPGLEVI